MSIRYAKATTLKTNVRASQIKRFTLKTILSVLWQIARAPTRRTIMNQLFAPHAYRLPPAQSLRLESARKFQVQLNGKAVQCWQFGHGPAILFVHGWNGRGVQFHRFFDQLKTAGYSAVIFDAPAHGESQGRFTNGFEIAETVRVLLNQDNGLNIQGIIAHSLGASAVVMALSRQDRCLDTVLIAPALKLRELLYDTFDSHGIPTMVYQSLIAEIEETLGYSLDNDNPHLLVKDITSKFLIVHDREDRTAPYEVSKEVSKQHSNVTLYTTEGLGHKKILADQSVIELAVGHFDRNRVDVRTQADDVWAQSKSSFNQ